MELQYKLLLQEVEESLLCLDYRREGRLKYINIAALGVIAGCALGGYVLSSDRFFLLALAVLSTAVLFALIYIPGWRRRKKAEKMVGGTYRVVVPEKGIKKGFESDRVITIQTQGEVYCIPKRVVSGNQLADLRASVRNNADQIFEVMT